MNDLIYRQQAINAIMGLIEARIGWKSDASKEINGLNAAYCVIEYLPSAEPRMKGRWIYGESEEGHDGYFCSQCGNFVPWIYKEFDIDFIKEFKFCPSCGADMRGDEDE